MNKMTIACLMTVLLLGIFSCGKDNVKPDDSTTTTTTTTTAIQQDPKFDDTAYKNVIAVLKEALENEKRLASVQNKYEAGRAFVLVSKFIKENIKDTRYGFTMDDLATYKNAAIMRFNDVINSSSSSEQLKSDAAAQKAKVSGY